MEGLLVILLQRQLAASQKPTSEAPIEGMAVMNSCARALQIQHEDFWLAWQFGVLDKSLKKNEHSFCMPKVAAAHRVRRREQILEAALRCFSRCGFHGTSMKDVCRQAKLSPGAVYLYFRSKESILQALAEGGRSQTAEWLSQCKDLSRVVDLMLQQLNLPEAQPIFKLDVQLWAEAIHTPKLAALFQRSEAVLLDGLAQIAKRASPKRTDQQAKTIARLLIAVMTGLELQKAMNRTVELRPTGVLLKSTLREV